MTLRSGEELWWGLSNILIFLCAAVMIVLLQKETGEKRKIHAWQFVYVGFGLAAVNGFLFHSFMLERKLILILWVIQYIFFYIAGELFHIQVLSLLTENRHPNEREKKILSAGTCVFMILTVVLHLTLPAYEDALYVFIGYAVLLLWPLLYLAFFGKHQSRWLKRMILVLVLSLLSQALSAFSGILVVLGHLFDVLALICGYMTAKEDLSEN